MNLHEYQAKDLLSGFGVPLPAGDVAQSSSAAQNVARRLPGERYVVKAQVQAGGRGRAGGVKIVDSVAEVRQAAEDLLGQTLVTEQTGPEGRSVRAVYVEEAIASERDIYVAVLVDRQSGRVALIGAKQGGEDIEERAAANPSIIHTLLLKPDGVPVKGTFPAFAKKIGLTGPLSAKAVKLFEGLISAFLKNDASLIEINPLAVTASNDLVALDVKMVIDDNALFRHPEMRNFRDRDELDPVELQAQENEINYVRMDGDIGVVVNGAGLALATHDMLSDVGGVPANFMDIRTTATSLDIAAGFDLLLSNPNVAAVLVNVHGGGMQRCDTIAEGIGISMKRNDRTVPLVVRFAGNNADYGHTLLRNYGIAYTEAQDMGDGIERVVALVRPEAA
ncbi:MAG: ADP-forming succinate--CoA ligase subunit beta [Hyphomicrobiaceae bacterium]|nr:ADP-forming succinate--CoA ligase subunit beta [Hyphomicrobiaceae bacterium]